jgi:hypothetical protein
MLFSEKEMSPYLDLDLAQPEPTAGWGNSFVMGRSIVNGFIRNFNGPIRRFIGPLTNFIGDRCPILGSPQEKRSEITPGPNGAADFPTKLHDRRQRRATGPRARPGRLGGAACPGALRFDASGARRVPPPRRPRSAAAGGAVPAPQPGAGGVRRDRVLPRRDRGRPHPLQQRRHRAQAHSVPAGADRPLPLPRGTSRALIYLGNLTRYRRTAICVDDQTRFSCVFLCVVHLLCGM